MNPHLYVNREELKAVFESITKKYPNIFGTNGQHFIPQGRCCLQHYYGSLFITPEGIFPCSGVMYKLGEAGKNKLSDIINHPIIKKLRNLPDFIEGRCKNCSHLKSTHSRLPRCYGGCRGNTFSLTGNLFHEDPLCYKD